MYRIGIGVVKLFIHRYPMSNSQSQSCGQKRYGQSRRLVSRYPVEQRPAVAPGREAAGAKMYSPEDTAWYSQKKKKLWVNITVSKSFSRLLLSVCLSTLQNIQPLREISMIISMNFLDIVKISDTIIITITFLFWVFHNSVSWRFLTGVWVTARPLKSPWPLSALQPTGKMQ